MTVHEKLDTLLARGGTANLDMYALVDGSITSGVATTKTETYNVPYDGKLYYKVSVAVNGASPSIKFKINGVEMANVAVTATSIVGIIEVHKGDVIDLTFTYGNTNRVLVLSYVD